MSPSIPGSPGAEKPESTQDPGEKEGAGSQKLSSPVNKCVMALVENLCGRIHTHEQVKLKKGKGQPGLHRR